MTRLFLAAALCATAAVAAPVDCMSGSLATYFALGSGGCRVGAVVVSDFAEAATSLFSTPVDASAITVTPIAGGKFGTLRFSATIAAIAGEFFESSFTYHVRRGVTSASLRLEGASAAGDGVVTAVHELNFLPQIAFQIDGDQELSAFDTIGGISPLPVRLTLSVDGGPGGAASFTSATVNYTVPEPSTILLSLGGAALIYAGRYRGRR
jgi:hypothetical protein